MAVSQRKFGWDLLSVQINGVEALGYYQSARLNISVETDVARSPHDTAPSTDTVPGRDGWRYPVEKSRRWTVDLGALIPGTADLFAQSVTGSVVTVAITAGGVAYTGNATFTGGSLEYPDGPATQGQQLIGAGPLAAV